MIREILLRKIEIINKIDKIQFRIAIADLMDEETLDLEVQLIKALKELEELEKELRYEI